MQRTETEGDQPSTIGPISGGPGTWRNIHITGREERPKFGTAKRSSKRATVDEGFKLSLAGGGAWNMQLGGARHTQTRARRYRRR